MEMPIVMSQRYLVRVPQVVSGARQGPGPKVGRFTQQFEVIGERCGSGRQYDLDLTAGGAKLSG